ncbi:MAG: hypothetical protein C0592_02580 [Marinilabiliales bacterium]|nr:MAG: hypothetical protein C0592_02580 [Marinilabiliales bacterium]
MRLQYFLLAIVAIVLSSCNRNIISDRNWDTVLFDGSQAVKYEQICYHDFLGPSTDGSVFEFYQYSVSEINDIDISLQYPNFEIMFDSSELSNISYSHWKNTPINESVEDSSSIMFIVKNSAYRKYSCSATFLEQDLLSNDDCFYSFFGAYPIGYYIFIYSPVSKILYIIIKK